MSATKQLLIAIAAGLLLTFAIGVASGEILVVVQAPGWNDPHDCGVVAMELRRARLGFLVSTCGPTVILSHGNRMLFIPDDCFGR